MKIVYTEIYVVLFVIGCVFGETRARMLQPDLGFADVEFDIKSMVGCKSRE